MPSAAPYFNKASIESGPGIRITPRESAGRPAAKGQTAWPAYDTTKRATMFIDAECKVINDPFSHERQVWDQVDPA